MYVEFKILSVLIMKNKCVLGCDAMKYGGSL
jgi:hypothetical protein